LASRYDDLLAVGGRIVAISVDSPQQHAALIEKLRLPFPVLSDPDRSLAIRPYGVADEKDPRNIARPAYVIIDPEGDEAARLVSGDFADRPSEDELIATVRSLGFDAAEADPLSVGVQVPGPKAMPVSAMEPYYRGAKFAVTAMRIRHPDLAEDAQRYIAELDRYIDAVRGLKGSDG